MLMKPALRYSVSRDAYVLRGVGHRYGPVLRTDRRHRRAFEMVELKRRDARVA